MSERKQIERALLEWMSEPEWQANDPRFETLALRLFAFQFASNPAYGRFCEARGRTPSSVQSWHEIPAVPSGAFKELDLRCFNAENTLRTFRTSGTSGEKRGAIHLDTLALYEASLRSTLATLLFPDICGSELHEGPARMTLRILAPSPNELPESSLSYMFGCLLADDIGDAFSGFDVEDGSLRAHALARIVERACAEERAIAFCGTAFAFVHLLDAFADAGLRFVCPAGSRIMETGGFKGRVRELSRSTLHAALHETLGIEPSCIVNQYGMTELASQFYDSVWVDPLGPRRKLGPPWARVRLVDPDTGEDVRGDAPGLVVIHDLANTGSVAAIQTADLGRWVDDPDSARPADPRFGRGFDLVGREPGAEARGCSIAADLMLGDDSSDASLG